LVGLGRSFKNPGLDLDRKNMTVRSSLVHGAAEPLEVTEPAILVRDYYCSFESKWTKIHTRAHVQTQSHR